MDISEHKRVIVDLAVGEEPIRGWVHDGSGPPQPFAGWLALSAALDRARGWVAAEVTPLDSGAAEG